VVGHQQQPALPLATQVEPHRLQHGAGLWVESVGGGVGLGSDQFAQCVVVHGGSVDVADRNWLGCRRFQRPQHRCGPVQAQPQRVVPGDDGVDDRFELLVGGSDGGA
jgi:hypothetical protein